MKKAIIWLVVLILIGIGIYYAVGGFPENVPLNNQNENVSPNQNEQASSTDTTPVVKDKSETTIGTSVDGRKIMAYHYGQGDKEILFVGGIHGGYEWNTVLLAYKLMDYLKANPSAVPETLKVTVIPVLNPDGLNKTIKGDSRYFTKEDVSTVASEVVAGRFNANNVDLGRNFDCDWKAKGVWQSKTVSGGTEAFSEPESLAFKNYIETSKPAAVVALYSSAGGVFSSSCHNGISSETTALTNAYAKASGYKAYQEFDFYEITGDIVNWVAKKNIPAISVLLSTHDDIEWNKNLAGFGAVIKLYSKNSK